MIVALSVLLIMLGWVLLLSVAGAVAGVSVNLVAIPVLSAGVALLAYGLSRTPRRRPGGAGR